MIRAIGCVHACANVCEERVERTCHRSHVCMFRYLASQTAQNTTLEEQIIAANPILESFGNAKVKSVCEDMRTNMCPYIRDRTPTRHTHSLNPTTRRHFSTTTLLASENLPKYAMLRSVDLLHCPKATICTNIYHDDLSISFKGGKSIVGSLIETYLLEKSRYIIATTSFGSPLLLHPQLLSSVIRVTKQDPGERNYHIFYMLAGLPQSEKERLGITSEQQFKYLVAQAQASCSYDQFCVHLPLSSSTKP